MLKFLVSRQKAKLERRYQEALVADDPHVRLRAAEEAIELSEQFTEWPAENPSRVRYLGRMHGVRGMAFRAFYNPNIPETSDTEIEAWQCSITYLEQEPDQDLVVSYQNAANAWFDHPALNRVEATANAIQYIDQAIELSFKIHGGHTDPYLLLDRSRFYVRKEDLNGSGNFDVAIADNEQALCLFGDDATPDERAMAALKLSALYAITCSGERISNTQNAIRILEGEWKQRSRDFSSDIRCEILNSLAIYYMNNPSGLPADNLEYALVHVEESLTELDASKGSELLFRSLTLLGDVLAQRLRGDVLQNLKRARDAYSQAKFMEWSQSSEVSVASIELRRHDILRRISHLESRNQRSCSTSEEEDLDDKSSNLSWQEYVQNLKAATAKISRDNDPIAWADSRSKIGDALLESALIRAVDKHNFSEEIKENLEQAIRNYQEALEIWQERSNATEASYVLANIGRAYRLSFEISQACDHGWSDFSLHYIIDPDFRSNTSLRYLENSIKNYSKAIELVGTLPKPLLSLQLQCDLAGCFLESRRWPEACDSFEDALGHASALLSDPIPSSAELRETLKQLEQIADDAPFAFIMNNSWEGAVKMMEASQAQLLARALTLLQLPFSDEERAKVASLRNDILSLEHRLAAHNTFDRRTPLEALIANRAELRKLLSAASNSLATRLTTIGILRQLSANGQIVLIPIVSVLGGRLLVFSDEQGNLRMDQVEIADRISLERLVSKRGALRIAWNNEINVNRGAKLNTNSWQTLLDETRSVITTCFTGPLAGILERFDPNKNVSLHVITHHSLNSLPLSVSLTHPRRDPLIEYFDISYSPSLFTTKRCLDAQASTMALPKRIATVYVEHDPSDRNSLRNAPIEAALVGSWSKERWNICIDKCSDATEQDILAQLDGSEVWHFSTHGEFNSDAPMNSRIVLGKTQLSLRTLFDAQGLSQPQYVILSACDTALSSDRELPHELIGMPSVFLQLGARGVIATQWPVNDFATTLLMGRLYQSVFDEGFSWLQALRRSQFWLRDATKERLESFIRGWTETNNLTRLNADNLLANLNVVAKSKNNQPFRHPIYWGPFRYYGN